jgi:hypothetical protein
MENKLHTAYNLVDIQANKKKTLLPLHKLSFHISIQNSFHGENNLNTNFFCTK